MTTWPTLSSPLLRIGWKFTGGPPVWVAETATIFPDFDRYYRQDVTAPFALRDGHLEVPTGPGIGVVPIPEVLEDLTTSVEWVPPGR